MRPKGIGLLGMGSGAEPGRSERFLSRGESGAILGI